MMDSPSKAQWHCDIFLDSITFKRLRTELESYKAPIMLICEESAVNDPVRRRLVSALHSTKKEVVDMRVPDGRFSREDLLRCCSIARETGAGIILSYDLGVSVKYAHAVSTSAWSESDPWLKYNFNIGTPLLKRIPFANVFARIEHYGEWKQAFGASSSSKINPDFAIQVTSAVY